MSSHLTEAFKCDKCEGYYKTKDDKAKHICVQTLSDDSDTDSAKDDEDVVHGYMCSICPEIFSSESIRFI